MLQLLSRSSRSALFRSPRFALFLMSRRRAESRYETNASTVFPPSYSLFTLLVVYDYKNLHRKGRCTDNHRDPEIRTGRLEVPRPFLHPPFFTFFSFLKKDINLRYSALHFDSFPFLHQRTFRFPWRSFHLMSVSDSMKLSTFKSG